MVAGAKREPSSLVQLTMQIGVSVSIPASLSVRTTSSAASVPSTPSYLPPVGWVSRWEPSPTGGFDISRPLRSPNIDPRASIWTSRPAASHAVRNQSRTCLSSGPSVRRRTPPFGVAPNFAVSWMGSPSLAESICRLEAILVMRIVDLDLTQRTGCDRLVYRGHITGDLNDDQRGENGADGACNRTAAERRRTARVPRRHGLQHRRCGQRLRP